MIDETLFLPDEEAAKSEPVNFATIAEIYSDGVTLRFDGEETPSQKRYKANAFAVFAVGDRVKIIRDSGTYIVEYPVGNPRTNFTAEVANNALKLNGKAEGDLSVNLATDFSGRHTGTRLSFFNKGSGYQRVRVTPPQAATVAALKTSLDALIQALQLYNLVY